jgi:hypothetical protein
MKIKRVEATPISNEELNQYKEKISKLEGIAFNGPDVGIDKRIITIRFGGEYEELTLTNPRVTEVSDEAVAYFEKDTYKSKTRKTVRYVGIMVDSDNLGLVQFSAENQSGKYESMDKMMSDEGLFECVLAQRLIDSIDGIDVNSVNRRYNPQIKAEKKIGRNERVMLQSPDGEMEFVKYKNAQPLLDKGYQLV